MNFWKNLTSRKFYLPTQPSKKYTVLAIVRLSSSALWLSCGGGGLWAMVYRQWSLEDDDGLGSSGLGSPENEQIRPLWNRGAAFNRKWIIWTKEPPSINFQGIFVSFQGCIFILYDYIRWVYDAPESKVSKSPKLGANIVVREVEAAMFISRNVVIYLRNMTCCKNHCTYSCDLLVSPQMMDDSGKRGKWWFGRGDLPKLAFLRKLVLVKYCRLWWGCALGRAYKACNDSCW